MTERMKKMLENPDYSEAIAQVWPAIDEVLLEQQRIMSSKDGLTPKELKGFVVAYRTLEKFKDSGIKSIESDK